MDKLLIECYEEYAAQMLDKDKKAIIVESLKIIAESNGFSQDLISKLKQRLNKLDPKLIYKTIREASKYKDQYVEIHNIAEDIE